MSGFGFGSPPQQQSTSAFGGGFGNNQQQQQPTPSFGGGGAFGAPPAAPVPAFGNSNAGFGANTSSGGNWGAAAAPPPAQPSGMTFGASPNVAVAPTVPTFGGGNSSAFGSGGVGFGNAPATPNFGSSSGGFGGGGGASTGSAFGTSSNIMNTSGNGNNTGFGNKNTSFGNNNNTGFGNNNAGPFGGSNNNTSGFGSGSGPGSGFGSSGFTAAPANTTMHSPFGSSTNNNNNASNNASNPFGTSNAAASPGIGSAMSFGMSSNVVTGGFGGGGGGGGFGNSNTMSDGNNATFQSSSNPFGAASTTSSGDPFHSNTNATTTHKDDSMTDGTDATGFGTGATSSGWPQPSVSMSGDSDVMADANANHQNQRGNSGKMSPIAEGHMEDHGGSHNEGPKKDKKEDELARLKAKIEEKKRRLLEQKQRKKSSDPGDNNNSNLSAFATPYVPKGNNAKTQSLMPEDLKNKTEVAATTSGSSIIPDNNNSNRKDLDTAVALIGICMHMCPNEELIRRQQENDIQQLEIPCPGKIHPANWTLRETAVKRFRRSAADYKLDIPELVRPPMVLEKSVAYLEEWIMDRDRQAPTAGDMYNPSSLDVYQFVWDRTRMIRKDFILQNYVGGTSGKCDAFAVRCHERIARWHAMCEHQLSHIEDFATMHSQQNIQELGQTMKTLNQYYDDVLGRSVIDFPEDNNEVNKKNKNKQNNMQHSFGCTSDCVLGSGSGNSGLNPPVDYDGTPLNNTENNANASKRLIGKSGGNGNLGSTRGTAEPEMRGIYILLTMNNDGGMEVLKYAAKLFRDRPEVYHSKPVQLALSIFKAKKEYNYVRFFSILRDPSTPYLFACIMFKHVELMRKIAFRVMSKTYGAKRKENGEPIYDAYPLKKLEKLLCFEDANEAKDACKHYNVTVKEAKVRSSSSSPTSSPVMGASSGNTHQIVDVVFWRHSDFKERKDPSKGTIVPLRPRKMVKYIESKLEGATRLAVCRGEASGEGASLSQLPSRMLQVQQQSNHLGQPFQISSGEMQQISKVETLEKQQIQSEAEKQRIRLEREKEEEAKKRQQEEDECRRRLKEQLEKKKKQREEEERKRQQAAALEEKKRQEKLRLEQEKIRKEKEELQRQRQRREEEMRRRKEEEEQRLREQRERERAEAEALARKKKAEEETRILQQRRKEKEEEEARKRMEQLRAEQERLFREEQEKERRRQEAEKMQKLRLLQEERERERRQKEAEAARELERKIDYATKLIVWKRWRERMPRHLYSKQLSKQSLKRIDPTFSKSFLSLPVLLDPRRNQSKGHVVTGKESTGISKGGDMVFNTRRILENILSNKMHHQQVIDVASMLMKRLKTNQGQLLVPTSYQNSDRANTKSECTTVTSLLKVGIILPQPTSPEEEGMCELVHCWLNSRLRYGTIMNATNEVDGAKSSNRCHCAVRVVFANGSSGSASACDMALVVIPPPWSITAERSKTVFSCIDNDVPRVVLVLGEDNQPEYFDSVRRSLLSTITGTDNRNDNNGGDFPVVFPSALSPVATDGALESACQELMEVFTKDQKCPPALVDRISVRTLGSICVMESMWKNIGLGISGQIWTSATNGGAQYSHVARTALKALLEELKDVECALKASWTNWPTSVFAHHNMQDRSTVKNNHAMECYGSYVSEYFGSDAHLPMAWLSSLSSDNVGPAIMDLHNALQGTVVDIMERLLQQNRTTDIFVNTRIREECEIMIQRQQFRRCIQRLLLFLEGSSSFDREVGDNIQNDGLVYVYLPRGSLEIIVNNTIQRVQESIPINNMYYSGSNLIPSQQVELNDGDHYMPGATVSIANNNNDNNSQPHQGNDSAAVTTSDADVHEVTHHQRRLIKNETTVMSTPFEKHDEISTIFSSGGKRSWSGVLSPPASGVKRRRSTSITSTALCYESIDRKTKFSDEADKSAAFTRRLEALLNGNSTVNMDIGNTSLNDILRDVPPLR